MGEQYICYDNWRISVDRLDKMSKKELEQVHCGLQNKMTKILSDRTRYQCENNLPENHPDYWKKMGSYRYALTKTQNQLHLVKTKLKEKNVEESNKKDRFYYMFFRTAQVNMNPEQFATLMKQTANTMEIMGIKCSLPDLLPQKEELYEANT